MSCLPQFVSNFTHLSRFISTVNLLMPSKMSFHCKCLSNSSTDEGHISLVVRKPAFCICENKDADQLHGNREADQPLCFCYLDRTFPLLPKSEISSL